MLSKFCAGSQVVIALDLPVSTDYQGLIQVLESLQGITDTASPSLITSQPVTLVSPSASGLAMVTWIMASNDQVALLPDYISVWVPVATGSLVQATDDQIAALQNLYPHLRILAINGNDDQAGGKYSTRLADLANATAVELVGRHAVYLQSPDDFVQTILNF
jgi:predicted MPP superfamily phosphohydrolase